MVFASGRILGSALAFLLAATAVAAVLPTAEADTARPAATAPTALYVNDLARTCSDSGAGTKAAPFCHVQAAANVVNPGQTVYIAGTGIINKTLTVTRSGTATAPITFEPSPANPAIQILPSATMPVIALKHVHDVELSALTVDQAPGQAGIQVIGSSHLTLSGVTVREYGNAAATAGDTTGTGIDVDGASSSVTLSRVKVDGTGGTGVLVRPGAKQIVVTTSLVSMTSGTGIHLDGSVNAVLTSNTVNENCGLPADITDAASAVVENNILATAESGFTGDSSCTGQAIALTADSSSAPYVQSDYNALYAGGDYSNNYTVSWGPTYSWAGTGYLWPADFSAATGQGAHDVSLLSSLLTVNGYQAIPVITPYEGSAAIDAADCAAPDELSTDFYGHARIDDPMVANAGNGTCRADRGAVERQDIVHCSYTVQETDGVAPVTASVGGLNANVTTSWGQPGSCTVDFGDGTGSQPATGATMTHIYTTPGLYGITVRGSAADGASETQKWGRVTVGTAAPPALTATVRKPPAGVPDTAVIAGSAGADGWEVPSGTLAWGDGSQDSWFGGVLSHGYRAPGTYTARLTATDQLGRAAAAATVKVTVGGEYQPLYAGSFRVYHLRVPAHGVVKLTAAQLHGVNPFRTALTDVTVAGAGKAGTLTVYPDGASQRAITVVAFGPKRTVSNSTLATLGSDGKVDFANNSGATVDLLIYTEGVEATAATAAGDSYLPLRSVQVLSQAHVAAWGRLSFFVAGVRGIPVRPQAVALELTAASTHGAGYLRDSSNMPDAEWAAGEQVTKLVVVPTGESDILRLFNPTAGSAVVSASVVGYYPFRGSAATFIPVGPVRATQLRIGARHTVQVRIGGRFGLPAAGVDAAMVSLTAVGATRLGAIEGWAVGTTRPNTPVLSYQAAHTIVGTALIPVSASGYLNLYNSGSQPVTLAVTLTGAYYQNP